ncbi:hypothetical protein VTO42DRAFT_6856 [Malbranchea cinnamomea]
MFALYLAMLLVASDRTIIATAISRITDDFHALNDIGWYGSNYLLTSCAFQLTYGRIYTFYSPKWVLLSAITLFETGSAICGAAPNSTAFIVGRAIAGLGSCGIFSGVVVIITDSVPLHKRPMFTGFLGGVFGLSSVIAPLIGGAFTEKCPGSGVSISIFLSVLSPLLSSCFSSSQLLLRTQALPLHSWSA